MVDFNQGLDLGEALQRCHMIDDVGLAWIEEPIVYDNLDGLCAAFRRVEDADSNRREFLWPPRPYIALQRKACDFVMPDFMRIGGVTGWLRAAAIAGAAGIPISTHLYPEVAAHVMRVTETAHWLEWQDWADPVLQSLINSPMACCIFLMCLALAWNGTKKRLRRIEPNSKYGPLGQERQCRGRSALGHRKCFERVRNGSTPVVENFEPNFRKGSGSGNSNRHHLALTSHEQRRPSLQ